MLFPAQTVFWSFDAKSGAFCFTTLSASALLLFCAGEADDGSFGYKVYRRHLRRGFTYHCCYILLLCVPSSALEPLNP